MSAVRKIQKKKKKIRKLTVMVKNSTRTLLTRNKPRWGKRSVRFIALETAESATNGIRSLNSKSAPCFWGRGSVQYLKGN